MPPTSLHRRHILALCLAIQAGMAVAQQDIPEAPAPLQWQASVGYHHYSESVMRLHGPEVGLGVRWSGAPRVRLEGQWWGASMRYDSNGTGSMNGVVNHEFRAVGLYQLGHADSWLPHYQIGLAGQYIYNDLRGRSSTNAIGYERISEQIWLPVRWQSTGQLLGLKAPYQLQYEVGWLLHGRQLSRLSQVGPGYADADNTQREGLYLQLNALRPVDAAAGQPYWEPYVRITRINRSDTVPVNSGSLVLEPSNTRLQFGVNRIW